VARRQADPQTPTISRVAAEAGVSRATVSRAFSHPDLLLPTTVSPLYALTGPVVTLSALVVVVIALVLTARMIWQTPDDLSPRFYMASTLVSLAGFLLTQMSLRGVPTGGNGCS